MKEYLLRRGWVLLILVSMVVNNGCWGRKFFHAPGTTMETSAKVDSLIDRNLILQRRIYALEKAISDQKDYSRSVNAQMKLDLEELKDQLNVLLQVLEETDRSPAWRPQSRRESAKEPVSGQTANPADSVFSDEGSVSSSDSDSLLQEPGITVPGPDVMYRQLYLDFSRMEYQLAIEGSEDFFAEYPGHPLGEEVRFIRGECYMELKKYFDALKEYSSVLQDYPRGKKIPSSLLRMAVAYNNIGDDDLAAGVVRRLVREYPGSEESSVARERFGDMLNQ